MQARPSPAAPAAGTGDAYGLAEAPATAVLDTNVVLDWLLFGEPAVAPLAAAIEAGSLRWLACAYMRDEFQSVLGRTSLARWQPDTATLLARFDRHARLLPAPPTDPLLRCADADDQVFVDLSRAHHARWLITRDGALLALARRAAPLGLAIVAPRRLGLGPHADAPGRA